MYKLIRIEFMFSPHPEVGYLIQAECVYKNLG